MNHILNDLKYRSLVDDILDNQEFKKLINNKHHGLTRLEHSLRVSYYSYIIAKKLKLNYQETARAGLLHDFFNNDQLTEKQQKISAFVHHSKALENSTKYYHLSKMEEDIIISHMFPLVPNHIPKYLESWLVSLVDKFVATYEYSEAYGPKIKESASSYAFLAILFFSRFNVL